MSGTGKRESLLIILIASAMAPLAASGEEAAVTGTNAGNYFPGQVIAAEETISLADGEFIVVVTDEADEFRLDGPFEGRLEDAQRRGAEAPEPDSDSRELLREVVAGIFGGPRTETDEIGGFRGPGDSEDGAIVDTRPSHWLAHAELTGDQCVLSGERPELWREDSVEGGMVEIESATSRASVRASWPGTSQRLTWPEGLPLEDEAIYLVRQPSEFRSTAIRLHLLNPALAGEDRAAAIWMAAKGCIAQARLLLASL